MATQFYDTTTRRCLGRCGRDFESQGPWHRLCRRCNIWNLEKLGRREVSGGTKPAVDVPEARDPTAADLM